MGTMGNGSRHDQAPFAAGVHLPWAEVPDRVRRWVEESTRSTVTHARDVAGGFSPGSCAILRLENGRSVFVKAIGASLNPDSPSMHRREVKVAAALPASAQAPRLLDHYDDGEWVALLFEEIVGTMPRHPWVERELQVIIEALALLHAAVTPCPIDELERTSQQFAWSFGGWRSLAAMPAPPVGLDDWASRNLDRLVELEAEGVIAADEGDTLVHGDIRSDNLLLTESSVVFVDWPHASVGAPVFDVVAWAPSVALEGGPAPEALLGRYPHHSGMQRDATTAVIAVVAGYFTYQAALPPLQGLPTLRSFQDAQGTVARAWLRDRTGWA
jgi:aminoglycoside phosphotransferase